jgi:hypothetical protein
MSHDCTECSFIRNADRIHKLLHGKYIEHGERSNVGEILSPQVKLERKIADLLQREGIDPPDAARALIGLVILACDTHDQNVKEGAITHRREPVQ